MTPPAWSQLRQHLQDLHGAALLAADPEGAVERALRLEGNVLRIGAESVELGPRSRVLLIAFGKAAPRMAAGASARLGSRVAAGIVAHPHEASIPTEFPPNVSLCPAAHPLPDEGSLHAGEAALRLVQGLDPTDVVVVLISGGGSALFEALLEGITLDDLRSATKQLQHAGADIVELNTVRRAISRVKGGGLARAAAPARIVTLVLSDVVGDRLEAIASGPTVDSPTTAHDALSVLERRGLAEHLPRIVEALRRVSSKPRAPLERGCIQVVGSNRIAARAVCAEAERLGFATLLLTDHLQGEAREAGRLIGQIARGMGESGVPLARPGCFVLGGETTVTVRGGGRGGRNLEVALGAAMAIAGCSRTAVFSYATDGIDGASIAAGAIVTGDTLQRAAAMELSADAALSDNDTERFFRALGDLWISGPTGTNVNDLVVALAYP